MHSRIFQLNKQPIFSSDYIGESDFWEQLPYGADYVNENTNKENDIQWFLNCFSNHGLSLGEEELLNEDGEKENCKYFIFSSNFKKNYFTKRFEDFKKQASDFTLDDFCHSFHPYRLKSLIEDKFTFRVYEDWEHPLDEFVRCLPDEETKYYIGNTIDYHY